MGEHADHFFRLMSAGPPRHWGYQARQILLLRERFATGDVDAALGHAASFGAFEHQAIERILTARATPRSLDEYVAEATQRRVAKALGEARTAPRDLTVYDRVPGEPESSFAARPSGTQETPCPDDPVPETILPTAAILPPSDSDDTSPSSD
jgi:hypothetical protein